MSETPIPITDRLPEVAQRIAADKARSDTARSRADHNAQVEQSRKSNTEKGRRMERRIIQRRVFERIQGDARQIAAHLKEKGVAPTPGKNGCHSLDRTHPRSPARAVHGGMMWSEERRGSTRPAGWEPVPADQMDGLERETEAIWPLRVKREFDSKKSKPGKPVYRKTGVGMVAGTGELVLFVDGDTAHSDKLLKLEEVRRPIQPGDLVDKDTLVNGVPTHRQPALIGEAPGPIGLQTQLLELAGQQLAGATSEPIWTQTVKRQPPPDNIHLR